MSFRHIFGRRFDAQFKTGLAFSRASWRRPKNSQGRGVSMRAALAAAAPSRRTQLEGGIGRRLREREYMQFWCVLTLIVFPFLTISLSVNLLQCFYNLPSGQEDGRRLRRSLLPHCIRQRSDPLDAATRMANTVGNLDSFGRTLRDRDLFDSGISFGLCALGGTYRQYPRN